MKATNHFCHYHQPFLSTLPKTVGRTAVTYFVTTRYNNFDENVFIKVIFLCQEHDEKGALIAAFWMS